MRIRKFLTDTEADSYIKVSWSEGSDLGSALDGGDAELKIADCNRNVVLYFPYWSLKQARKSLKKLSVILGILDKLKEHLENKIATFEQHPENRTPRILAGRTRR